MSPSPSPTARSRARKVLGVLGGVVFATVTFTTSAVVGLLLNLDTPAVRRVAVEQLNHVLASSLAGRVEIMALGHLGLDGVRGIRVRVIDPTGREVAYVDGVRADVSALAAAKSAMLGKGPIRVDVTTLAIDYADIALDDDGTGTMRLLRAFEPKEPSPPKPDDGSSRGLRLELGSVALKHGWIHGAPSVGAPALDVDADALVAKVLVAPKETKVDLTRATLAARGMPQGMNPHGNANFHLAMPSITNQEMGIEASFEGDVGGIPSELRAAMDGKKLDAIVDVRRTDAASLRAVVPEAPVEQAFEAHAEVHGTMPALEATATAGVGRGQLDARASVRLAGDADPRTHVSGRVVLSDVDARAFSKEAPESSLGAIAQIVVALGPNEAATGNVVLDVPPGRVDGTATPAVNVRATLEGEVIRAQGMIHEPGAPVSFDAKLGPNGGGAGGSKVVDFVVATAAPELAQIRHLEASKLQGKAAVHARGRVDLGAKSFDAAVEARVAGLAQAGERRLDEGALTLRAIGTFDHPILGGALTAKHNGVTLTASVDRLDLVDGGKTAIEADGIRVVGLGEPLRARVKKARGAIVVEAASDGIDLGRVAKLAGVHDRVRAGTLAFDVDAKLRRKKSEARVDLEVRDAEIDGVREARAKIAARLSGRDVSATLDASVGEAGTIQLTSADAVLDADDPLEPRAWKGAHGRANLRADLTLDKIAALLPTGVAPFGEMKGQIEIESAIGRDAADVPPEVRLSAKTRGLVLAAKTPPAPPPIGGTEVVATPAWRTADVDLGLDARIDATSGLAELAVRAFDRKGPVAAFDTKAIVPYREIFAASGDRTRLLSDLERAPFKAVVWVPRRRLEDLPAVFKAKGTSGSIAIDATAEGTALRPDVRLDARLDGITWSGATRDATRERPIDVALVARYDGERGQAALRVGSKDAKTDAPIELLAADAHVDIAARDLVGRSESAGELPWKGGAHAKLMAFPLESVAFLSETRVRGLASGEVTVDGLHEDAKARAHIEIQDLAVGRVKYTKGTVDLDTAGPNGARVEARLAQSDGGYFALSARAATAWGAALAPSLDEKKPLEASIRAERFRVAALQPFVGAAVSELDGRLQANARAKIDPQTKVAALDGTIALREGVLNVPAMGEQLRGVTADVKLSPDGSIQVDNVEARASEGRLTANAFAKLSGMNLERANAKVRIGEKEAMPIALQGQELGRAYGDVEVKVEGSPDGKRLGVNVDIPSFHMKLPTASSNSVQELEPIADVRVGVHRQPGKLTMLPLDRQDLDTMTGDKDRADAQANARTLDIAVHLGKDVVLTRSTDIKVAITGDPKIHIASKTEMTGQLTLSGGFLDVQGKRFEIERGTVTFSGEPGNPTIVVTASWQAPEGTMVYADFVGPLKTGKVTLRSEPARPKNEILALIVFGSAEGSQSTPYPQRQPDGRTRAVAMGGAFATQGLNKGIEDLTGSDRVTTKVNTTESANPRPELQFQVTRDVSISVAHVLGVPPFDQPDTNFVIADWRMMRNWVLETTFGDRGTSIMDAVWQYRY